MPLKLDDNDREVIARGRRLADRLAAQAQTFGLVEASDEEDVAIKTTAAGVLLAIGGVIRAVCDEAEAS